MAGATPPQSRPTGGAWHSLRCDEPHRRRFQREVRHLRARPCGGDHHPRERQLRGSGRQRFELQSVCLGGRTLCGVRARSRGNLVAGDTNLVTDVFLHDRGPLKGVTALALTSRSKDPLAYGASFVVTGTLTSGGSESRGRRSSCSRRLRARCSRTRRCRPRREPTASSRSASSRSPRRTIASASRDRAPIWHLAPPPRWSTRLLRSRLATRWPQR